MTAGGNVEKRQPKNAAKLHKTDTGNFDFWTACFFACVCVCLMKTFECSVNVLPTAFVVVSWWAFMTSSEKGWRIRWCRIFRLRNLRIGGNDGRFAPICITVGNFTRWRLLQLKMDVLINSRLAGWLKINDVEIFEKKVFKSPKVYLYSVKKGNNLEP